MKDKVKNKNILILILKIIFIIIIFYYLVLFSYKFIVSQFGKEKADFPFEITKTGSNELIKIEEKK